MLVYLNGEFIPLERARISPEDRAFLFADGVYEALVARRGRLLSWEEHERRLRAGLAALRGGSRQRGAVVAGRMREHAAPRLLLVERPHGVAGAAHLEGADPLQVLALEEERRPRRAVEARRGDDRRAPHEGRDARRGGLDVSVGGQLADRFSDLVGDLHRPLG